MEWISVNERKPENLQKVLAIDTYSEIFRVAFNTDFGEKWRYVISGGGVYVSLEVYNITHWMPLPEPPKIK